jgi:hypothetical protein
LRGERDGKGESEDGGGGREFHGLPRECWIVRRA